jgi:mannonate dehydratase
MKRNDKLPAMEPGIKLGTFIPGDVTDDFLVFLTQTGVDYVYTWLEPQDFNYEFLSSLKKRVNAFGLTLFNVGIFHLAKIRAVLLGLPGRDEEIERFKEGLAILSKAGIHTTTITWEQDGVWASNWEYPIRGGAVTRSFNLADFEDGRRHCDIKYTQFPIDRDAFVKTGLTHGRVYTIDELWKNFKYFMQRVIPAAEEYGVRIALHPNDPPVESMGGVPCLIRNFDDYKRAMEIAGSDYFGMELCCGCWVEASNTFGNIHEAIDYFVKRNKIFVVHFRNTTAPLPSFAETFIDEGHGDLYGIMRSLVRSGYNGTLVPDHSPRMVEAAGIYGESAFANGYIKALMKCAQVNEK